MRPVQWQRPARRRTELGMIALVLLLTGSLYILANLGQAGALPAHIVPFLVLVLALMLAAHISLRRLAPNADPVLLPLVALLNGIGYVFIAGLDSAEASAQATWTAIAIVGFVATLALFPRALSLERYRYTIALGGITLLLLPLVPHIGQDINGARLWVRVGPLNFQPEEFAKVALAIFFASVLAERADLLATGTRRIGRWLVLEPRYVAPLIGAWGVSLLVLLAENDLGSSFLFFTLFVTLLWVATGRWAYLRPGRRPVYRRRYLRSRRYPSRPDPRPGLARPVAPFRHIRLPDNRRLVRARSPAACGDWGRPGEPPDYPEASTDFIFAIDRRGGRPGRVDRAPDRLPADRGLRAAGSHPLPALLQQAVGHRLVDAARRPGVRRRRRYHQIDPYHRDHVAVCLLRRVVPRLQLHTFSRFAPYFR